LPSSLTRVLPFACVSSTRLPVSVCGTGTGRSSLRSFSRQWDSATCGPEAPPSRLHLRGGFAYPVLGYPAWHRHPLRRLAYPPASLLRSRPVVRDYSPVVHHLRFPASAKARLTRRGLTLRRKPWTFGEHGSHMFFATHASILSSGRSTRPCRPRFLAPRTLPYYGLATIPGFGDRLKPRYIIRAGAFDQ
jgi:hypothetical protein